MDLTASSTERAGSAKIKKTVTEEDMVSAQNGSLSRLWREAMLLRPGVSTDTNFESMPVRQLELWLARP